MVISKADTDDFFIRVLSDSRTNLYLHPVLDGYQVLPGKIGAAVWKQVEAKKVVDALRSKGYSTIMEPVIK